MYDGNDPWVLLGGLAGIVIGILLLPVFGEWAHRYNDWKKRQNEKKKE